MTNRKRESERPLARRLLNEFIEFLRATEIIVMAMVVATVGGVWWTVHGVGASATASSSGSPMQPAPMEIASAGRATPSAPNVDETRAHASGSTAVSQSEPEIDFSQTSWENPFTAAHWDSTGWSFEGGMMQSISDGPAEAVFRRSYRKLRLDLHLERLGTAGTFEVRFHAPAAGAVMTVTFSSGEVVVSADCPDRKGVIKRRNFAPEMAAEQPAHWGLMATGNRVRIIWNDRPLLACTQPASQSGRDLTFALISRGAGFRVSGLRIEGE